ncbi:MAG: TusE/DsrC/DsvC family sulfur relay protein [Thermodesulfobacteriota bacterium]
MKTTECGSCEPTVDANGFLVDPNAWNEDVARVLAGREGVTGFSDEKLEIIRFIRNYYAKHHVFPILNYVCKSLRHQRECVSDSFGNPMVAWKIAGLPEPSNISFVSLDGTHFHMEECC